MSFRRDRDATAEWHQWVKDHEAELIAIGIPREVWEDRLTWWQFVDHGYHPPVSNRRDVRFSADDLTPEKQRQLHDFLDRILPAQRYSSSLWGVLHHRFKSESDDNHE